MRIGYILYSFVQSFPKSNTDFNCSRYPFHYWNVGNNRFDKIAGATLYNDAVHPSSWCFVWNAKWPKIQHLKKPYNLTENDSTCMQNAPTWRKRTNLHSSISGRIILTNAGWCVFACRLVRFRHVTSFWIKLNRFQSGCIVYSKCWIFGHMAFHTS